MKLGWVRVLSLFSLTLSITAIGCAASDDSAASDDDEIRRASNKVSGYDFTGPKALANDRVRVEFCTQEVNAEEEMCTRLRGQPLRANGCKVLCSKPIAPQGKAAGYDLTGYQIKPNDSVPVELCAAVVSEVQAACERVQGEVTGFNGCGHLCSKPIAPQGSAAGFDLSGFKILPNDKAPVEFCAAVVSPVQSACEKVRGQTSRVNGCKDLCSLPL